MTQAQDGNTVKVHYTGKLEDGSVFDTSTDREPLEFTLGDGQLIAGFEEAVAGMSPGDTKTAHIPADQAYGEHDEDLVLQVQKSQFPAEIEPEIGQQLELRQEDGHSFQVVVAEVGDDVVTLDANHPLAGEALTFDIELIDIVN